MQSKTLKIKSKIHVYILILLMLLTLNCENKKKSDSRITISIRVIDSETKKSRISKSDTIQIRMVKFGYLKKSFVTIGRYITDTTATIRFKLDPTEEYHISLYGANVFGWADFDKNILKDGQEIILEASPPEKR